MCLYYPLVQCIRQEPVHACACMYTRVSSILVCPWQVLASSRGATSPYACLAAGALLLLVPRVLWGKERLRLDGKLVLVNGVTSRLGGEVCRLLAQRGAHVIMVAPKNRPLESYIAHVTGVCPPAADMQALCNMHAHAHALVCVRARAHTRG